MTKRNLTLYVDDNLITIARSRGWNLSDLFNSMLQGMTNINSESQNIKQEDIDKKRLELQKELNKLKALEIQKKEQSASVIEIETEEGY